MKVELSKEEPKFQPVKISFTCESEIELQAILSMSLFNESIPDLVGTNSIEEAEIVRVYLNKLKELVEGALRNI